MGEGTSFERFRYIVKTLSRTKRKDYENYVVNAIYNRVGDMDLKPVTQQYVKRKEGRYAFIDLYFPQLNIGIECDEMYHDGQLVEDAKRTADLFDVMNVVNETEEYTEIRIDIDSTHSFEKIEEDINAAVDAIRAKLKKARKDKQQDAEFLLAWLSDEVDPAEYYSTHNKLRVSDKIRFKTIVQVSNTLFGTNYPIQQKAGFIPASLREKYGEDYMLWFPKCTTDIKSTAGWDNSIDSDGLTITEVANKGKGPLTGYKKTAKRITFMQMKDPVTAQSHYRFVGVFEMTEGNAGSEERKYSRDQDVFDLTPFR